MGEGGALRLIRAADCTAMRWRNGGGSTTEIAVGPPGARLDAFDWRLSRAVVASNGPFSLFPKIDRTLVVCTGAGLRLHSPDGRAFTVGPYDAPVRFAADVAHDATLIGDTVTDLNVMTRRERASHSVVLLAAADLAMLGPCSALRFLVCLAGTLEARAAGLMLQLQTDDTLRIEASANVSIILRSSDDARAALVEIHVEEERQ